MRVERTIQQMSEAARQIAGNAGMPSTITVDVSHRVMAASGRAGEASECANSPLNSAAGLAAASRTPDGGMDDFLAELRDA